MKSLLRFASTGALFAMIAAMLATPVFAISHITNRMSISPTTFSCSTGTITIKTSTDFEWDYIPNPYSSDYKIAIAAQHMRKPTNYYTAGQNATWVYRASEGAIDNKPAWWYGGGSFLVVTSQHHEVNATTRPATRSTSPAYYNGTRRNWHGQSEPIDSWGPGIWVTTNHTSSGC